MRSSPESQQAESQQAESQRRPTLSDVARLAGVSTATASKALNDRRDISPDTRSRVLDAVSRSGYRRTTGAPAPRRPTIVAIAESFASPYSSIILDGMAAAAAAAGAELAVSHHPEAAETGDVDAWTKRIADAAGVVLFPAELSASMLSAATNAGLTLVVIDPIGTPDDRTVTIGATNWQGGRTATEHMIELGHSRIAWIGGVPGSIPSEHRHLGFLSAMQSAGLTVDEAHVSQGGFSYRGGMAAAETILDSSLRPTAIVCGNDRVALGVIQAARARGMSIPNDVSVIGFDDIPQAAESQPALTTVKQPLGGMGKMAVETALSLSRGGSPTSAQVQLATTLIVRETTAPPIE